MPSDDIPPQFAAAWARLVEAVPQFGGREPIKMTPCDFRMLAQEWYRRGWLDGQAERDKADRESHRRDFRARMAISKHEPRDKDHQ